MDDILGERKKKLEEMRKRGIEPFPSSYASSTSLTKAKARASELAEEEIGEEVSVVGRVSARRGHGSVVFLDLMKGGRSLQVVVREDICETFSLLETVDIGDFLGLSGRLTKTRRGEPSLLVDEITILAKSLRPLPDKFHGLRDKETRYRRRELDLLSNNDVLEVFQKRSEIIRAIREYLAGNNFLEVETPILQSLYGGALAEPFETHHNTLDQDMYLRIAPELYLKRLLVGGIDRVFEIGKDFRNEGVSTKHNPEFTMLEYYETYTDYRGTLGRFREMMSHVVETLSLDVDIANKRIDFSSWQEVSFRDSILQVTGLDIEKEGSEEKMREELDDFHSSLATILDHYFSRHVEPTLIQPTFILDYPLSMSPFAKANDGKAERWEAFLGGMEIANSFSELNDPDEQRRRFQEAGIEADETFLLALEQGMPPSGGVGLGIDRLVMLLLSQDSIRDVILFPTMRSLDSNS
jgi:lysyl-tRNA synthetase class 2